MVDTSKTTLSLTLEGLYEVPVYYEDTDFSGYVYHANYLKFMERGREHLLGLSTIKEYYERGYHFVVKNLEIDYLNAARHGDTLTVRSTFHMSRSPRVQVIQRVHKKTSLEDSLLTAAKLELVFVGPNGRPTRIPSELIRRYLDTNSESAS